MVGKRESKPGQYQKSPNVQRTIDIGKKLTTVEANVSQCVFAGIKNAYQIMFETDGVSVPRVVMESLLPNIKVHAGVIDLWSKVLNHEERYRDPKRNGRIFCTTDVMSNDMLDKKMYFTDKFNIFKKNMDGILSSVQIPITDADMIMFPIIRGSHFYLICFDLKNMECAVIDNMKYIPPNAPNYDIILTNLMELMMYYLATKHHPKYKMINNCKTEVLDMPWKTKQNATDCGVFVMRHMETYQGQEVKSWNCGLVKEENEKQIDQLDRLRHKYVAKILMSNINNMRESVIKEADVFAKLKRERRIDLFADAEERVEERVAINAG